MSNVAPIMDRRLAPSQLNTLSLVAGASGQRGAEPYLVGGTVRDLLLGGQPADLDLSVVGGAPGFVDILANELNAEVVARSQFGTSKLRIDDTVIDLATARKESYAYPGALPTVSPGSIQEDLARRDFSINAMAVSLSSRTWGDLLDPFNGQRDLRDGLIRVLHPESFVDDATRILRAIRYAQRLGFRLESTTEVLIGRDLTYLDRIKGDRVRRELERVFCEQRVASILEAARELGVLSAIYPPLTVDDSMLAKLQQVATAPANGRALLVVSLLAFSLPTGDEPGLIARLNMDTRWAKMVRDTVSIRDAFDKLSSPSVRPSQLYHLLDGLDAVAIRGCAIATEEPLIAQRLELYQAELWHVKPHLNGDDLMALGVPRGPMVGRLLDEILTARLDGVLGSVEEERQLVARRLE